MNAILIGIVILLLIIVVFHYRVLDKLWVYLEQKGSGFKAEPFTPGGGPYGASIYFTSGADLSPSDYAKANRQQWYTS